MSHFILQVVYFDGKLLILVLRLQRESNVSVLPFDVVELTELNIEYSGRIQFRPTRLYQDVKGCTHIFLSNLVLSLI